MHISQPHNGRATIELLLNEQRLTLDEMLRLRTALDQKPGGLAQTHPLVVSAVGASERQFYTPIQRTNSAMS